MGLTHHACHRPNVVIFTLFLLACFSHGVPSVTSAETPIQALERTSQKAIVLLADPELLKTENAVERRKALTSIIGERFSCDEMAKRSLGDEWSKLTPTERQEFVRLFQALLAKSYVAKIEAYAGQPVQYLGQQIDNGYATVSAKVRVVKNEFLLDFQLLYKDGEWLVYDVVVDGVSQINSYRGQFARVLRVASYEELIERMREKAEFAIHARAD
jgi:phospholipid transport system substrate-binding protein